MHRTMQDLRHSAPSDKHPRDATFTLRLPRALVDQYRTLALANERSIAAEMRLGLTAHVARTAEARSVEPRPR